MFYFNGSSLWIFNLTLPLYLENTPTIPKLGCGKHEDQLVTREILGFLIGLRNNALTIPLSKCLPTSLTILKASLFRSL